MSPVTCPACFARQRFGDGHGAMGQCPACAWWWTRGAFAECEPQPAVGRQTPRSLALVAALALFALITVVGFIVAIQSGRTPAAVREAFGGTAGDAAGIGLSVLAVLAVMALTFAYVPLALWVITWIARDADSRGHVGALWALAYGLPQGFALWAAFMTLIVLPFGAPSVTLFLGGFGLVLYLQRRRPGWLVACRYCTNRFLDYAATCPHCGCPRLVRRSGTRRGPKRSDAPGRRPAAAN
jgi:hypothetical protein